MTLKTTMMSIVAVLFCLSIAKAQDCNCDHFITSGTLGISGDPNDVRQDEVYINAQPGDVICLEAGDYPEFNIRNIEGSSSNPIRIINCGGIVRIGVDPWFHAFTILDSRYFTLSGSGSSDRFGIVMPLGTYNRPISNAPSGLVISGLSSDYEIERLKIDNSLFAGMLIQSPPQCDYPDEWRRNFNMRNVSIHDCEVTESEGEGLYIGYTGFQINCGEEVAYPHLFENLKVFNNEIRNSGWCGIQINRADQNLDVHHNKVFNAGTANISPQNVGIHIGLETSGNIHHNYINGTSGLGLEIKGIGGLKVFNNIIVNTGSDGIYCNDQNISTDRPPYQFINNTVVNTGRHGIYILRFHSSTNGNDAMINNLVCDTDADPQIRISTNSAVSTPIDNFNNHVGTEIADGGFNAPLSGDYSLLESSPAIDNGFNSSSYGITDDYTGTLRPQGEAYDIGAMEYIASDSPTDPGDEDPPVENPPLSARTQLTEAYCDATDISFTEDIAIEPLEGDVRYLVEVTYRRVRYYHETADPFFKLNEVQGLPLSYRRSYRIRVRLIIADELANRYGTACRIRTASEPMSFLSSESQNIQNAQLSTELTYEEVDMAEMYEIRVSGFRYYGALMKRGTSFGLYELPGRLRPNRTYQVTIRYYVNGFRSPFGPTYSFTTSSTYGQNARIATGEIAESMDASRYELYTNPVNNLLSIKFNAYEMPTQVILYNLAGQKVYEAVGKAVKPALTIPVHNLSKGMLLMKIYYGNEIIYKKVLKE
ncbi:choice-of-anchor Q domain-containing protein [Limibacter armeniacum]|uniref:choice-of-anchor Q domain-containing protein n=1 Tax=Limibacter armeniacum TaxID=466084 RepID=UPI002FE64968